MDAIAHRDRVYRDEISLDTEGLRLEAEINEAIRKIPNNRDHLAGRRAGNRDCILGAFHLLQRLYAEEDPRDDNSPAFNHVARVMHRLAVAYGVRDTTIIIAGGLHDSVEDHPEKLARIVKSSGTDDHAGALKYVKREFGFAVKNLVDAVSKRKSPEGADPDTKILLYTSYAQKVARNPAALLVKIADVCDNVSRPRPAHNGGFYSMKKYALALPILRSGLERNKKIISLRWGKQVYERAYADVLAAKTLADGFLLSAPITEG